MSKTVSGVTGWLLRMSRTPNPFMYSTDWSRTIATDTPGTFQSSIED
jgi:hypothetical protein